MTSIMQMINMAETIEERRIGRYETDVLIIDTCSVTDGKKPFETAVCSALINPNEFTIVEAYDNADEAKIGHEKWIRLMTSENAPHQFNDCENRIDSNDFFLF